jgi:hypothetical protein
MTPETTEIVIKDLVKGMCKRLEQAAHITKAAYACAASGSPGKGIEIVSDLGQDLHEVDNLLGATLAVSRMSKA